MLELMRSAGCLVEEGSLLRSSVRFSTCGPLLFVHSAYPTTGADAVFFGPDTYRYLALLRRLAPVASRGVDVGCGSGAGGLAIAAGCAQVMLTDINERALRFARINAAINGIENATVAKSDVLSDVEGPIDLVISNPPYLIDDLSRTYRDGGGRFGEALSVEIVRQALDRLAYGGRLILYTAAVIADGHDTFHEAIEPMLRSKSLRTRYEELDPDVFGEELERPAYAAADRIAVVALDVRKF
jgi:methylase of polypeptide subunit release factors